MSNLSPYTVTIITKDHTQTGNNVLANAAIEIRDRLSTGASGSLSIIYEDQEGLVPITQTGATTNALGQLSFFAASGEYNAVYNNGTLTTIAIDITETKDDIINDLSQAYIFDTVAEYKAFTKEFPTGKAIHLNDRNADFTVINGTGSGNNEDTIASDEVSQSIGIIVGGGISSSQVDSVSKAKSLNAANNTPEQLGGNTFGSSAVADNTLIKNSELGQPTRVHIEPNSEILNGTTSKQDWMFDPYDEDPDNYRIFGTFLQTGDQSGNGRNAEANHTLKSVNDFYGGFPLAMWGYQDNSADRAICMKQFYMDIAETEKPTPNKGRWQEGLSITAGDYLQSNNFDGVIEYNLYKATTSGTTGATQPIHAVGTASDGGVTWEFVKDYYATAAANELIAMMLFGRRSDYPIAGGHTYSAQFSRGLGIHQGEDLAFFDSDGTLTGRRVAIGSDIYDYYKDDTHYHRHTETFTQHVGGGTILSTKTVDNDDGGSGITVDARGTDVLILSHSSATSISTILCDANQFFRIRVVNADVVTLNNGASLRLVGGTQLLGVRSVISFFARTGNQAIEDGYVGS